jgi:hypothetical protein
VFAEHAETVIRAILRGPRRALTTGSRQTHSDLSVIFRSAGVLYYRNLNDPYALDNLN